MLKTFFFLMIAGVSLGSLSAIVQIDILATLSKLAWIVISVFLVIFGNRHFKKRDEERQDQKDMFKDINKKMDGLGVALLAQDAQYQGMMAKMEVTSNIMGDIHRDVKEHARIIGRIQGLLKDG